MIPARPDPHQGVVHFKKRWLSQERALSSEGTSDQAASVIRPYAPPVKEGKAATPTLVPCPNSPSTATMDPSPFQFDQSAASSRRRPSAADGISLCIPRFAKYGAHAPLLAQCSTASSTLCSPDSPAAAPTPSTAADHPQSWLLRAASSDAETSKIQLGSTRDRLACQPSVSSERFMIDINKPPPSPEAHYMDSEMTPSTPCSAPSADLPGLPKAYGMTAMDYSFSELEASAPSWLTSALGNGDSRRAAAPASRKGPHAQSALLHLPTLRGGLPAAANRRMPAELAKRHSGLSLSFSEQDVSPPPPFSAPSQLQQQKLSQAARHSARSGSNGASVAHQGLTTGRRSSPAGSSPQSLRKPRSHWHITGELLAQGRHAKAESEEAVEQGVEEDEENEHEGEEGEEEEEDEEEEGEIVARRGSGSEEDECGSRGGSPKACLHCNTTKTPLWRNGPPGPKSLCNACGIRFNKIRSGKRKPTPKEAAMLLKYEQSGSTVTGTGTSDVSASSSPERSSSKASVLRGEKRQGLGNGADAETERKLLQSLPVAGAHKSRSKMQRQNSTGGRAGAPAVKVALFGGRKRSPECEEGYTEGGLEEGEDDEEARPLRLAFQHKSKRACLAGNGYATGGPSKGPSLSRLVSPANEGAVGREGDSSDHESCLSEPGQSPPESPRVWKAQRGLVVSKARYEAAVPPALPAQMPMDEADAEDDSHLKVPSAKGGFGGSDIEIGARMLMEIFHSSPLVMC